MLTVVLSLIAAVNRAFHDFLVQPVTRRAGAFTAMFWVLTTNTALLMAVSLSVDGLPSGPGEWRGVAIAALGGILYVSGLAVLLHGLAVGNLSIVTPLASLMGGVGARRDPAGRGDQRSQRRRLAARRRRGRAHGDGQGS